MAVPTIAIRNLSGAWAAQSVKQPTLGFGSGHDLTVCEFEPCVKLCSDSMDSLGFSLPLSLSLSLPPLQLNIGEKKKKGT